MLDALPVTTDTHPMFTDADIDALLARYQPEAGMVDTNEEARALLVRLIREVEAATIARMTAKEPA